MTLVSTMLNNPRQERRTTETIGQSQGIDKWHRNCHEEVGLRTSQTGKIYEKDAASFPVTYRYKCDPRAFISILAIKKNVSKDGLPKDMKRVIDILSDPYVKLFGQSPLTLILSRSCLLLQLHRLFPCRSRCSSCRWMSRNCTLGPPVKVVCES